MSDQKPLGSPDKHEGPPDLEVLLKRLMEFGALKRALNGGAKPPKYARWLLWALVPLAIAGVWALSGLYVLKPEFVAVEFRFGRYLKEVQAGIHWFPRFVDTVVVLKTNPHDMLSIHQSVLTSDGVPVSISLDLTDRIVQAKDFLLNNQNLTPDITPLVNVVLTQVVAQYTLSAVLDPHQQALLSDELMLDLNALLNQYTYGLVVSSVKINSVDLSEAIRGSLKKYQENKAQADADSLAAKNQAQSILQQAKVSSESLLLEAQNTQALVKAKAQQDFQAFETLLPIYQRYPEATIAQLKADAAEARWSQVQAQAQAQALSAPVSVPAMAPAAPVSSQKPAADISEKEKIKTQFTRWMEAQQ